MEIDEEVQVKQGRVREKKIGERLRNMDEQTRQHIKQMKICILEEDDVGQKEE